MRVRMRVKIRVRVRVRHLGNLVGCRVIYICLDLGPI